MFVDDQWTHFFNTNVVRYLARNDSDHRSMLVSCQKDQHAGIKYFKFLDFWTDQPSFMHVMQESWNTHVQGNSMWTL